MIYNKLMNEYKIAERICLIYCIKYKEFQICVDAFSITLFLHTVYPTKN